MPGGPPPDERYEAARLVAAAWLLDRDPPGLDRAKELGKPSLEGTALAALHRAPAAEQRARITALRDAELACAPGDRLGMLLGTGGAR